MLKYEDNSLNYNDAINNNNNLILNNNNLNLNNDLIKKTNKDIAEILIDGRINYEYNGLPGQYTSTGDKNYGPFTIFGNDYVELAELQSDRGASFFRHSYDNEKLSVLHPSSTTGSLSSIITTSIASSEPDPGSDGGGGGGVDGDNGENGDEKIVRNGVLKQEEWWKTTLQVSIPFFIAGIGTIAAGIILGRVEHWAVFVHVTELFILVPALLGLKGNLDMCLASRLSTQANLGNMNSAKEIIHMIIGNVALVQVQAAVAAFIVSIFAIVIGAIMNKGFEFDHAMLVIASSMFTATSSCFVLDFVLVAVILLSRRFKMNPDNLATPLAASIGDVVSISLLSFIASLLFENLNTHLWVTFIVVGGYFTILPFWIILVIRNKYTRHVLSTGWVPVLSALFISGMGGLVLDAAVGVFHGFVVFQPIINGIGGNLVSVQASKISTMLHQSSILGIVPPHSKIFELPWRALFNGVPYAKTARILILMSIPGQILFIFAADYIHLSESTIGVPFIVSYLMVSLIQIMGLLYIAHVIIHAMWKFKIDPDNSAIPYLTALGDLSGSSLLLLAFLFLRAIGTPYGGDLTNRNASDEEALAKLGNF